MKAWFTIFLILCFLDGRAFGGQDNKLGIRVPRDGERVESPDGKWKISIASQNDGNYGLLIQRGAYQKDIDKSGKPIFRILWCGDNQILIVIKLLGFCTMASVYSLNADKPEVTELFNSSQTNARRFVDYRLKDWRKKSVIVFEVYENLIYSEEHREPRLLSIEYIYTDGKTQYTSK